MHTWQIYCTYIFKLYILFCTVQEWDLQMQVKIKLFIEQVFYV